MLKGLNHITLAVSNIETSLNFYTHILGFKGHVKWENGAYISLGELWLCLSLDEPDKKLDYTHIAFGLDESDFLAFKEKIIKEDITQWKSNTSEGDSLYILDPDGHKLEVHVGNLESRLESLKSKPFKGLVWL